MCVREGVCAVRSRTGCGEVDIGVDLPSHALFEGSHRAHLHLYPPGDRSTTVQVVTASYHVVKPPKVELSFPWDGQHFSCGGPLTLIFGYSTDLSRHVTFLNGAWAFTGRHSLSIRHRGLSRIPGL